MDNIFDYDSYDTTENFIIDTLDEIINKAILKNASDIHIEPFEKTVRIRYRIDGCLHVIKNQFKLSIFLYQETTSKKRIFSHFILIKNKKMTSFITPSSIILN